MRLIVLFAILLQFGLTGSVAEEYYKVTVTKKGDNLYAVDGQSIYLKTKYCYEYAFMEDAIIVIDTPYSTYQVGKIIFPKLFASECPIEKLLK